ncbi:MAG TPA: LysE family transporter [Polyangia bacterium]|jgi:threonine/homoserine/homoserine lactone efflux protein
MSLALTKLWLWGLAFGVVTSIPTGPSAVLMMNAGLRRGARAGGAVLGGLVCIQIGYMILFWLGLAPLVLGITWLRLSLFLLGGVLVALLGVREAWRGRRSETGPQPAIEAPRHQGIAGDFLSGLVVAATNPGVLLVLAGLVSAASETFGEAYLRPRLWHLFVAVEVGVVAWFAVLVVLVVRLGRRSHTFRRWLSLVASTALIAFGCFLIYKSVRGVLAAVS